MSKKGKPVLTRRQKRWRNGRLGAIFGFTAMYINGFFDWIDGFSEGALVLEYNGGWYFKLLQNGEQIPLIWLLTGSYFSLIFFSFFVSSFCFLCFFGMDPDKIDEIIENYKSSQKK